MEIVALIALLVLLWFVWGYIKGLAARAAITGLSKGVSAASKSAARRMDAPDPSTLSDEVPD